MLNWPTAAVIIAALILAHGAFMRYLAYRAATRNSEP
jgi:hypothetical protein